MVLTADQTFDTAVEVRFLVSLRRQFLAVHHSPFFLPSLGVKVMIAVECSPRKLTLGIIALFKPCMVYF